MASMQRPPIRRAALLALTVVATTASLAWACQIPVFRYALERWQADAYEALVFHRGPLSEADLALVDRLENASQDQATPVNLIVTTVDLADDPAPALVDLWSRNAPKGDAGEPAADAPLQRPQVLMIYPRLAKTGTDVAWSAPLSEATVASLVDSPLRQKIADRLLKGDSAVWVLLESGDKARDDAAAAELDAQLRRLEKELKLPTVDDIVNDESFLPQSTVELRLAFSTLRLSRTDPAEQFMVNALLGTESDLRGLDEPMAFAIFGRGRALWALVGKGINPSTMTEACGFLTGPCSCQVKDLNPGVDMLMAVNWDGRILGKAVVDQPLPELTGLSALQPAIDLKASDPGPVVNDAAAADTVASAAAADTVASAGTSAGASDTAAVAGAIEPVAAAPVVGQAGGDGAVLRNTLLVVLAGVVVVAVGAVVMTRKSA